MPANSYVRVAADADPGQQRQQHADGPPSSTSSSSSVTCSPAIDDSLTTPMSPVPLAAVPAEPEHSPLEVTLALIGAFAGGVASAISVNMGAMLTPFTGHPIRSSLILYIVSISVMSTVVLCMRGWRSIRWDVIKQEMRVWQVPLPGLLGSSSIAAAVVLIPYIQYATFAVCVIVGQLVTSLVLDHFGFLKIPVARMSIFRFGAVSLISIGAVCVEGFDPDGNGSVTKLVLIVLCLVSFGIGVMPPLQAGLNKLMAYRYGSPFNAALMSFSFGTLNLTIITLFLPLFVAPIDWSLVFQADWYLYSGGFFGGSYVFTTCICPRYLGASLYFVAVVSGQLLASVVIDITKIFPSGAREINAVRIGGVCCVVVGVLTLHLVKKREARRAASGVDMKRASHEFPRVVDGEVVEMSARNPTDE